MSRASTILERLGDENTFWIVAVAAIAIAPVTVHWRSPERVRYLQRWLQSHGLGQHSEHVVKGEDRYDIGIHVRGGQSEAVALGQKINELLGIITNHGNWLGPYATLPEKYRGDLRSQYELIGYWDYENNRYVGLEPGDEP